jgi:hypothetical protein
VGLQVKPVDSNGLKTGTDWHGLRYGQVVTAATGPQRDGDGTMEKRCCKTNEFGRQCIWDYMHVCSCVYGVTVSGLEKDGSGEWIPMDASDLGFRPGEWPASFSLGHDLGPLFQRGERKCDEQGEFVGYVYSYRPNWRVARLETVMIFND